MLEIALKLLKKIEASGFEAYIVGGYVRDFYMKKNSSDLTTRCDSTDSLDGIV